MIQDLDISSFEDHWFRKEGFDSLVREKWSELS